VSQVRAGLTVLIVQGHLRLLPALAQWGDRGSFTPSFAGLMALVFQKTGGCGEGNANPISTHGQNQFGGGDWPVYHEPTTCTTTPSPWYSPYSSRAFGYDLVNGWGSSRQQHG